MFTVHHVTKRSNLNGYLSITAGRTKLGKNNKKKNYFSFAIQATGVSFSIRYGVRRPPINEPRTAKKHKLNQQRYNLPLYSMKSMQT